MSRMCDGAAGSKPALFDTLMVQVICLTIDDKQVICIAPVVHAPDLGIRAGKVQAIEFGELMPASLAVKLFQGPTSDEEDRH